MNKGVPPARFRKIFDLSLSFQRFEFFEWPAAFYFILKYDAEMSLFEVPFDASSKSIHTLESKNTAPHADSMKGGRSPQNSHGLDQRPANGNQATRLICVSVKV